MQFKQSKLKLIYVYDALCGWCYGFSKVIEAFYDENQSELDFEAVSGGMITGNRIGPIGEVAPYISHAYKDVEKATGIIFGDQFLNHTLKVGTVIFTSIPPAIALSVFKTIQPDKSVQFATRLGKAIYYDGIDPGNLEAYGRIADEFGIDSEEFVTKLQDPVYKKLAERDFTKSQDLGVTGFPTLFVQSGDQYYLLARGCVNLRTLQENYTKVQNYIYNHSI